MHGDCIVQTMSPVWPVLYSSEQHHPEAGYLQEEEDYKEKCRVRHNYIKNNLSHIDVNFFRVPKDRLLLHLRPIYIHSASNDIHTDGPRARATARARSRYLENLLIQHI